uniref:Minor tail protein n=1 Tax=Pseudomonas phage PACT201 TaxID=3230130 RepID=A0AAU8GT61_9VIRU
MAFNADVQKLEPGNLIRLFEVDATRLGGNLWRFHGHAQEGEIIWQGNVYEPIQITAKGFDIRGDGRPASPTPPTGKRTRRHTRSDIGHLPSVARPLWRQGAGDRDVGGTIWMPRTSLMCNPDAADEARMGIWFIEQKTEETREQVSLRAQQPYRTCEGQIATGPADHQALPVGVPRSVSRRGLRLYPGAALFTKKDEPTDNPALDRCGGRWSSCKLRGNTNRFGGSIGGQV